MEGNKDDGLKCIDKAEQYLASGNVDQAIKFLRKAERLYPTDRAKALLDKVGNMRKANSHTYASENSKDAEEESCNFDTSTPNGTRRRSHADVESDTVDVKYTSDQLDAVKRIRKSKDYYEILGVAKDCNEDDLKKSYKKLALKFHPDKNHAPGAGEAFKAISNAFGVLSNPTKRQQYDQFGTTDEREVHAHRAYRRGGRFGEYDYSRGFEGDISAEDLFNMFFGGGFPANTRVYTNVHRHHSPRQTNESSYGFLLQMSPLILMILLSLLSALLIGDPAYSLYRDSKYYMPRTTRRLSIQFFVKEDFLKQHSTDEQVRRVESQVENEYMDNLHQNCYRERNHKENTMWRARMYNNPSLYEQAKNLATPSCDKWRKLQTGR